MRIKLFAAVSASIIFIFIILGVVAVRGDSGANSQLLFLIVSLAGAFGGLLYTARDSGIELPHLDPDDSRRIKLGFIADCAYGLAGGYVVFLILPIASINTEELTKIYDVIGVIKLSALALIGGYGGRSLVDRALGTITKDLEEAKKSARTAQNQIHQIQEVDTKALELVGRYFEEEGHEVDVETLKNAIASSSKAARFQIFKQARQVRTENWKKDLETMAKTIPVFEALIANTAGEKYHRNHGQLGYALKDLPDPQRNWSRAYNELSTAIRMRDASSEDGFLMYEFNRAICGVMLKKSVEEISQDLKKAVSRKSLSKLIQKETIFADWANKHKLDLMQILSH